MKLGDAIAEILRREGIEIITGYPVNHVLEYAAAHDIRPETAARGIELTRKGTLVLLEVHHRQGNPLVHP
jgi:phytoene dehydrogenase-like protein